MVKKVTSSNEEAVAEVKKTRSPKRRAAKKTEKKTDDAQTTAESTETPKVKVQNTAAETDKPETKAEEKPRRKPANRRTRKVMAKTNADAENVAPAETEKEAHAEEIKTVTAPEEAAPVEQPKKEQKAVEPKPVINQEPKQAANNEQQKKEPKPVVNHEPKEIKIPACPTMLIRNIVELGYAPQRQLLLNDQQLQVISMEEAEKRFRWIEGTLALVLDYDVVLSDTNIWLELLVGHTSSHSDPRVNARLQFERQMEFISKLTKFRGGRFMMMSETYEEIDRFATQQEPTNYKDADWSDESLCRNVAARLAKRLILSMQRENRLRIEGIGAESHHGAFADPAIIRRTVELFAKGKKVLLITNDASVAIRSMGMCDDLQRHNNIDDETWDKTYAPLRPMAITMDDLKMLDAYTRQYHFLQQAAGKSWMEDVPQQMEKHNVEPLELWLEGFRPGDKHSERHERERQRQKEQQKQQQNQPKQAQNQQQNNAPQQPKQEPKPQQNNNVQQQPKQEPKPQQNNNVQQPKPVQNQQPKQEQKPQPENKPQHEQKPQPKPEEVKPEPVAEEVPVAPETEQPVEVEVTTEPKEDKKPRRRRPSSRRPPRKPKAEE